MKPPPDLLGRSARKKEFDGFPQIDCRLLDGRSLAGYIQRAGSPRK